MAGTDVGEHEFGRDLIPVCGCGLMTAGPLVHEIAWVGGGANISCGYAPGLLSHDPSP